jgi:Mn-dependent DtxR family transcriptional regulator
MNDYSMETTQAANKGWGVLGRLSNGSKSMQILDFMIENRQDSYTIPEISKFLNISNKTTFETIKKFYNLGLVKLDRLAGITRLYKLNEDLPAIKMLMQATLEIASREIDLEIQKDDIKNSNSKKPLLN